MHGPKFRFIHAADLHLDAPFAALGRVAPEIGRRLRDASLEAFDSLVRMAIDREVAFVIFAGDIYDSADRGVRAQLRFVRGVERLGEHGIRVFVAHGNHDPADGWSAVRRPPENLIVFGADAVESYPVGPADTPWAHVYGISYPRRDVTENLALRFQRGDTPGLHIGVLHSNVGNQPDHPAYSPCSVADLMAAGMDYWALGHIHQYRRLAEGRPWIVYPGSLQAMKSSEIGPRGAVAVKASGGAIESVDFVALDRVRFARIEIDSSGEADLRGLQRTILERAVGDTTDVLLTVTLTGRGPIHRDLRRPGALEDLLRDVREELGVASPFVWVDRIVDRTGAELDREAIARRGDFSAELIRVSNDLRAHPQKLAEVTSEAWRLAERFEMDDPQSLLREAEERALDLLEGEPAR